MTSEPLLAADLLDRAAVAERLGIKVRSLDKLRERAGARGVPFPQPVQTFARTPLWRAADIDDFAALRGRPSRVA